MSDPTDYARGPEVIMHARRFNLGAALVASGIAAAFLFGSAGEAQAQIRAGVEGGMAYRSSDPKLDPGMAAGAHAEIKLVPMLSIGPYFLWYSLNPKDSVAGVANTAFHTWGGRVRFTLPLPGSSFRPFAYAGLGRTGVSYPGEFATQAAYTASPIAADITKREGWFLEVPIGLGLGYQILRVVQLSADFALRPGFSFKGEAYEGDKAYDKPTMGLSFLLGAAIDI